MKSADNTITKFCACFGYYKPDFVRKEKPEEKVYDLHGMNIAALKKMLIKNDMDEYLNELSFYWYVLKYNAKHTQKLESKEKVMTSTDLKEYEKDLTETLIHLLSNEYGENTSITFQKSRNSLTKANNNMLKAVTDGLIIEYEKYNFNETELTFEEAEDEIKKQYDMNWLFKYVDDMLRDNPDLLDFDHEEYDSFSDFEMGFEICFNDQMVENYALEHSTKRDITLEFLKSNFEVITKSYKKKAGAKPKNNFLVNVATALSYLKRVDRFIQNKDNVRDINLIRLTNRDYRFIHDCLVFFELIEDYSLKELTTTTPEKYIRTTLNQKKQNVWNKTHAANRIFSQVQTQMMNENINVLKPRLDYE